MYFRVALISCTPTPFLATTSTTRSFPHAAWDLSERYVSIKCLIAFSKYRTSYKFRCCLRSLPAASPSRRSRSAATCAWRARKSATPGCWGPKTQTLAATRTASSGPTQSAPTKTRLAASVSARNVLFGPLSHYVPQYPSGLRAVHTVE